MVRHRILKSISGLLDGGERLQEGKIIKVLKIYSRILALNTVYMDLTYPTSLPRIPVKNHLKAKFPPGTHIPPVAPTQGSCLVREERLPFHHHMNRPSIQLDHVLTRMRRKMGKGGMKIHASVPRFGLYKY